MRMILKGIQQSIIFMLLVSTPIIASSQTLTWLGTLANGTNSTAYGVSDDGSMVVGEADGEGISGNAFLWKASNKRMQSLPNFGELSRAYGISSDGTTIVGTVLENDFAYAVRWINSTIIEKIDTIPDFVSTPRYISKDGESVVGNLSNNRLFQWNKKTGMKILNIPSEFPYILITGLSGDGSVVIGNVWNSTKSQAFRWVNDTVIFLPNPQQYYSISATSISADGSVIAGSLISGTQSVAARWIGNKEFIIDTFPNAGIWKNAPPHITSISSDHFVMIGSVRVGNTSSAYRWYVDGRSDNLNETYANLLDFGSELIHVYDASSDGRFIVGQGYNSVSRRNEAFILDTQGTPSSSTDVNEKSIISLYPITPNPINGISTIHFSTPEKTYATLSIVDILGRKIATLADQEFESGKHSQTFDASTLSGGLYYCQLKIGETVKSQKMIIMK